MSHEDRMKSQNATNKSLRSHLLEMQANTGKTAQEAELIPPHLVPVRQRALTIMQLCESINALAEHGNSDLAIRAVGDRIQEIAYEIITDL